MRQASPGRPSVLCLHASGASSRQWDALAARLAASHRVLAVDLAGHGRSAGWGPGETPSLAGEVARLEPALPPGSGTLHVVGHSYGAAVAVRLALAFPGRVASLALYEPVLFRLLLEGPGRDAGGEEIVRVAAAMRAALDADEGERSARLFVDYWSGEGAWSRLAPGQRAAIAGRMGVVMGCFDALFGDRTRREALAGLEVPTLLLGGSASPASARAVAGILAQELPQSHRRVLEGVGHMGPVTHPGRVNEMIARFLETGAAGVPASSSRQAPAPGRIAFA